MKAKNAGIFIGIVVLLFLLIFSGITLTKNVGKTENQISEENAASQLERICEKINVQEVPAEASSIDLEEIDTFEELPPIEKYPLTVENTTETYIEIFSSPEKAGDGKDGWLNELANSFNEQGFTVGDKKVSVAVRSVSSGLASDYIISTKYVPDAFTPSNSLWGEIIRSNGRDITMIKNRLVGNVAGVMIENNKYTELMNKYGSINMKSITEATEANEITMGYTDPFTSTTGLNFLLSTLYSYDTRDILSDVAVEGFNKFQKNIPFVSSTTLQMRTAAESGELNAFILEEQLYVNSPELTREYKFVPFGIRHDNPLYQIGSLEPTKEQILTMFADYCLSSSAQEIANKYGFNQNISYVSEIPDMSGDIIIQAQKIYKKNKGAGRPNVAVFISDISGSMKGERINNLKKSLINSIQYIDSENYIGMISYDDKVYINLPIAKFDLKQKSLFKGASESLEAGYNTATFDAIAIAVQMLNEAKQTYPDARPIIFLLSDGEQNVGCSFKDISPILESYKIPIYTIGYDANLDALKRISSINEAAAINSDTDDIVYQLKNLFNSQM